jgi:hypothetical protein
LLVLQTYPLPYGCLWWSQGSVLSDPSHRQFTTRSQGLHRDLSQHDFWDFSSNKLARRVTKWVRGWASSSLQTRLLLRHGSAVMVSWQISQPSAWKIANSARDSTVLSQEAKEHIDALAGGTFFVLNAEKVWALFEKLSASKRESEEYGLKENFPTIEIDSLTRKF